MDVNTDDITFSSELGIGYKKYNLRDLDFDSDSIGIIIRDGFLYIEDK